MSSAEVGNEWNWVSTSPTCLPGMHKDDFTFFILSSFLPLLQFGLRRFCCGQLGTLAVPGLAYCGDAITASLVTCIRMWRTSNLWWVVLQLSLTHYTQGDSGGGDSHCHCGAEVCMNICLIRRGTETELFDSTNTKTL